MKKGLEEIEMIKKTMELENEVEPLKTQVKEYEQKLAEALPLLESLDQSRSEVRESRRKSAMATEELNELRQDNKTFEEEIVRCKAVLERTEAARLELEKQLESEREEALWLSEVEARQMREMEAKSEELQARLAHCDSERAGWQSKENEWKNTEAQLRARIEEQDCRLLQTSNQGSQKDLNIREFVERLKQGQAAMEKEVAELRQQLTEAQQSSKMSSSILQPALARVAAS